VVVGNSGLKWLPDQKRRRDLRESAFMAMHVINSSLVDQKRKAPVGKFRQPCHAFAFDDSS
jgi:hypothetical protein